MEEECCSAAEGGGAPQLAARLEAAAEEANNHHQRKGKSGSKGGLNHCRVVSVNDEREGSSKQVDETKRLASHGCGEEEAPQAAMG